MASDPCGRNLPDPAEIDWSQELARHDPWLRAVVYARVRNRDELEEVMQEVALAAVKQSSPILQADKVGPWLYRLAVRQTLLLRRKAGRQRKVRERFATQVRPAEQDHRQTEPLAWLVSKERAEMVRQALDQLRPGDSELLLLKYIEHWSYQQIADHLGVSHSTVESRLHRARARLRERLSDKDTREAK